VQFTFNLNTHHTPPPSTYIVQSISIWQRINRFATCPWSAALTLGWPTVSKRPNIATSEHRAPNMCINRGRIWIPYICTYSDGVQGGRFREEIVFVVKFNASVSSVCENWECDGGILYVLSLFWLHIYFENITYIKWYWVGKLLWKSENINGIFIHDRIWIFITFMWLIWCSLCSLAHWIYVQLFQSASRKSRSTSYSSLLSDQHTATD